MKKLLDSIKQPYDIQKFTESELQQLADECRQRVIEVTSQTGGHLASSLGTVEITVALFKLFDFRTDRVVWDVGHQAYVHKLLTGRHPQFHTLSKKGGVKKFLSRFESEYDHFGAGHASTSISAALGMAIGQDLDAETQDRHSIAVIGDGALTGGLAFEALNHNGYLGKKMIVILNDNGISIDPNVGALSKMITRVIVSRSYNRFRDKTWLLSGKVPFSQEIRLALHKVNASLKTFLTPGMLFEQLGWRYFGPIDGHNIPQLLDTLEHVKELSGPIVIHALTKKGKGYTFAEEDAFKYHGVTPFVPESGEFIKKSPSKTKAVSYSSVFGSKLGELMEKDKKVVGVSAAMMSGTGMLPLKKQFPERIFDVGIAEGHAVTAAAGMATSEVKPFVAIYSTFLQRAIDHIIHDVAIQKLPVRFMLDRAGLVGADGPTHQGLYDLTYLRMIPGMVVLAPKDGAELKAMIQFAYHYQQGPIAVRYPRGTTDELDESTVAPVQLGKSELLGDGSDIAIFGIGSVAHTATELAKLLEERGISMAVVNARFVKPLDTRMVKRFAKKVKLLVTLEENTVKGGFGSAVLESLSQQSLLVETLTLGAPDRYISQASPDQQQEDCGISVTLALSSILQKWNSIENPSQETVVAPQALKVNS